jgi:hypothetical protein
MAIAKIQCVEQIGRRENFLQAGTCTNAGAQESPSLARHLAQ